MSVESKYYSQKREIEQSASIGQRVMVYVMCPIRFPVVVEWLASVTFWNRATLYTKSVKQASQVGFFGVALDYFYRRQIKK